MQREELEEKESSLSYKVTKEDVNESIKEYLGKYTEVLKSLSMEEYKLFQKLLPKVARIAYFVKGDKEILKKFKAFFIAKCVLERYDYSSIMLKDYIEGLMNKSDNELFVAGVNRELLFLYLHKESSGSGNTDNWVGSTTLDRIVNRERKGLITVIFSERDFPQIEKSDEVRIIDLGGAAKAIKAQNAVQSSKTNDNSQSTTCYD